MKRTAYILFIITMLVMSQQAVAQESGSPDNESQSNGVFDMQAVYLPDFIAFKQVADREFKQVDAYLVSGDKSVKSLQRRILHVGGVGWEIAYIAGSEFRFLIFDIPKSGFFEAEKIKIVADDLEMFYDVSTSAWDN